MSAQPKIRPILFFKTHRALYYGLLNEVRFRGDGERWLDFFAEGGTTKNPIAGLKFQLVRTLDKADLKERLLNSGMEAVGSSPEEFVVATKSDMARWGKVIKDAGVRVE